MTRGVSRITGKSEGGKARTDPELLAQAVAMVDAGTHTPDQAAAEIGVVGNTVRRAIARRDAERASSGTVEVVPVMPGALAGPFPGGAAPPPAVAPVVAPPPARIAPRAVAPELVLVRRILSARAPDALAELEAGLLEAARGEVALAAWLTRPVESEEGEEHADPLDALRANLAQLTRSLKSLPKGKANASLYNSITTAVKAIEGIMQRRPREPTKDEIEERIAGAADEARAKIVEYTDDAYAKLNADRAELGAWARSNLGPLIADELDRRIAAMLGEDAA